MEAKILYALKSVFIAMGIAAVAFALGLVIVNATDMVSIVNSQLWELATIAGALILLSLGAGLIVLDRLIPFPFILASFALWSIGGYWLFSFNEEDVLSTLIWCIGVALYLIVVSTSWLLETEK